MIGLSVQLNGKQLVIAGADDLAVLNAIVNAVGMLGKATVRYGTRRQVDLWLTVGGLTRRGEEAKDEHLNWLRHKRLKVGDEITVQVIRTDRPDKHREATFAAQKKAVQQTRRSTKDRAIAPVATRTSARSSGSSSTKQRRR